MACMENVCANHSCGWMKFSNESVKACPDCGGCVSNFWDEQLDQDKAGMDDFESPDDYDDIDEDL